MRRFSRCLSAYCLLVVLVTTSLTNEAVAVSPTHADVRYGRFHRNVLDVYVAPSARPTPVLIYFHGGGWMAGDKGGVRPQAFLANGITVVAANYR